MSHNKSLVNKPTNEISLTSKKRLGVISRMTEDVLDVARNYTTSISQKRFVIGDYELREPDYQQIVLWAEMLEMETVEVFHCLEKETISLVKNYHTEGDISFLVEDGAIISLIINFDILPLSNFKWVDGISIQIIGFKNKFLGNSNDFFIKIPSLEVLDCSNIGLNQLDLSSVKNLKELDCGSNELIEIDLSLITKLSKLSCSSNQLTELDLSPVPQLTQLLCMGNKLTELDLSSVPALTCLGCYGNLLIDLDLSPVPKLEALCCFSNQLTELDLSSVPLLTSLNCKYSSIKKIDIRPLKFLENLITDPDIQIIKN